MRKSIKEERDELLFGFFQEELKELHQMAQNQEIDLVYFDESGFNLNPNVPYAWQEKGKTALFPAIRTGSITALTILDIQNQKCSGAVFQGAVDAICVDKVLEQFSVEITRKTVLILDNASIHKAENILKKQKAWKERGLFLQFIPAYCPELNLMEILWKQMKHFWLKQKDYTDLKTLDKKVLSILRNYGKEYPISFG